VAIGNTVANVVQGVSGWVEENPETAELVLQSASDLAANNKRDGEQTIEASKSVSDPRKAKITKYIGEYRLEIGRIQTQLIAEGIVTKTSQAVSIRNILADELYSGVFTDSDQKATLIYIIKKIDDSY